MMQQNIGISALNCYFPNNKIDLKEWCQWRGIPFEKIKNVVGTGFRLPSPCEDIYTMAANASLNLILENKIDPSEIGLLSLGTETSKDNALGAIIIKGMLNTALSELGIKELPRECEVPEFKHACLGGIYALKNAVRYFYAPHPKKYAIVIASDIAKYPLLSSGESTQGSGAIAILIEQNPKLLNIDLSQSVSSSDFRYIDFRKPLEKEDENLDIHLALVNGKFSSFCYLDEVRSAFNIMKSKHNVTLNEVLKITDLFSFHRPFKRMPENALTYLYILSLMEDEGIDIYCEDNGIDKERFLKELQHEHNFEKMVKEQSVNGPIQEEVNKLISIIRPKLMAESYKYKIGFGIELLNEIGNTYSSSIFINILATLESCRNTNIDLVNKKWLAVGYGSGNACEILPLTINENWQHHLQSNLASSLATSNTLGQTDYEALHKNTIDRNYHQPTKGFIIDRVGQTKNESFEDQDITFYKFLGA